MILDLVVELLPITTTAPTLPWPRLSGVTSEFGRDGAATAIVFGSASAAWFGWAQEDPPEGWRRPLVAGSLAGVVVAGAGAIRMWQDWSSGSAIDAESGPIFGIIVGIEFAIAALGSLALIAVRRSELIAPWVALVVGIHFFFLAPLLEMGMLYGVAVLVTIGAVVSVPTARIAGETNSAMTGVMVGLVLLGAALLSLLS